MKEKNNELILDSDEIVNHTPINETVKQSGKEINFSNDLYEFFNKHEKETAKFSRVSYQNSYFFYPELKIYFEPTIKIFYYRNTLFPWNSDKKLYIPQSNKTVVGWPSESVRPDIQLQIPGQSRIVIEQYENYAKVYETKPYKLSSKIQIIEDISIKKGDVFKIGSTRIEIDNIEGSQLRLLISSKSILKTCCINKTTTIGSREIKHLGIHDQMISPEHICFACLTSPNSSKNWVVRSLNPSITVWKYLSTKDTLSSKDSPTYDLKWKQIIQFGKNKLWIELNKNNKAI
jgi:hypothetical protein